MQMEIKISLNTEQLFSHTDKNMVRFPDERSEWGFGFSEEEFKKIMDRPNEDKPKLIRIISIRYSSLNGGKIYHYKLEQSFSPLENQWKDISEEAS
jgi:hypothetical protein